MFSENPGCDIIIAVRFMKLYQYKLLFYLLRGLVYAKRGVFWLGLALWFGLEATVKWLVKMLGLKIYKVFFAEF